MKSKTEIILDLLSKLNLTHSGHAELLIANAIATATEQLTKENEGLKGKLEAELRERQTASEQWVIWRKELAQANEAKERAVEALAVEKLDVEKLNSVLKLANRQTGEARAELKEARELLELYALRDKVGWCGCCGFKIADGHAKDCKLQAFLAKSK